MSVLVDLMHTLQAEFPAVYERVTSSHPDATSRNEIPLQAFGWTLKRRTLPHVHHAIDVCLGRYDGDVTVLLRCLADHVAVPTLAEAVRDAGVFHGVPAGSYDRLLAFYRDGSLRRWLLSDRKAKRAIMEA